MIRQKYLLLLMLIALFETCSPPIEYNKSGDNIDEALSMLESVFEGPQGKFAIGEMMDTVLILYKVELTSENYLKIGNMLVEKRKASDGSVPEMTILAHMISTNSGQQGVSIQQQLNKSARAIQAKIDRTSESRR